MKLANYLKRCISVQQIMCPVLLLFSFISIISFNDAQAVVKNEKDVYNLSVYLGVEQCYNAFALDEVDLIEPGTEFDYKHFFNTKGKFAIEGGGSYKFSDESAESVWIPSYVGTGFSQVKGDTDENKNQRRKDSNLSCEQTFTGWKTNVAPGLKQISSKFPPTNYEEMGYVENKGGDDWTVSLSKIDREGYSSEGSLRIVFNGNNVQTCNGTITIHAGGNSEDYILRCSPATGESDNGRPVIRSGSRSDFEDFYDKEVSYANGWIYVDSMCGLSDPDNHRSCTAPSTNSIANMMKKLIVDGNFNFDGSTTKLSGVTGNELNKDLLYFNIQAGGNAIKGYKLPAAINPASTAAGRMLFSQGINENIPNEISEDNRIVHYSWNSPFKYALYYHYLNKMEDLYPNEILVGGEGKCGDSKGEWEYAFRNAETSTEGKPAWCEVHFATEEKKQEILDTGVSIPAAKGMKYETFQKVLEALSKDSLYSGMSADDYAEMNLNGGYLQLSTATVEETVSQDQGENASGTVAATCQNAGGAGALGWIVCPMLEWMGNAAEDIYTSYIDPSLKIDPQLFQEIDGSGSPTQDAWGMFQTIANVVFIILLLVVIFSQLTGIGIDNYGIKRILPKLIVVAILVNLSYLICVICVDLSNVLGSSLKGLFDSLGARFTIPEITAGNVTLNSIGNFVFAPVTILVALVLVVTVGIATGLINPGFLLTLLISALGVVISILFIFVLFAAREAAVVVLTVVSPIAFVCYALPNTKKIFDKWLKAWEGLLLVYPICGLLIGGGDYVSRLLLTIGGGEANFFKLMIAMVVGVVPVFFIPTLLKGSFAAMGNIGAKVSGVGKALSGRATKAATNSETNKRAQQRGTERQTRIRAGVDRNGNEIKMGGFRRFIRGGKRSVAQAREQYTRDQNAARRREGLTSGVGFSAALIAQQKAAERDELSDYMTLINDRTRNGEQSDELNKMFDEYMKEGNKAGAVAVARIAGRRKDTAASFVRDKLTGVDASQYDPKMLQSVAKEVATGENSSNYLGSSPLAFEFAAQINRGTASSTNYTEWVAHQDASGSYDNVHRAMSNYVTDSKELVGVKNSSLGEIAALMANGKMDASDVDRLKNLANETINNRAQTGVWDTTKAENIYRIAGQTGETTSASTEVMSGEEGARRTDTAPAEPVRPSDNTVRPVTTDSASSTVNDSTPTDGGAATMTPIDNNNEARRQVLFDNNGVTNEGGRSTDGLLEQAITGANPSENAARIEDNTQMDVPHETRRAAQRSDLPQTMRLAENNDLSRAPDGWRDAHSVSSPRQWRSQPRQVPQNGQQRYRHTLKNPGDNNS